MRQCQRQKARYTSIERFTDRKRAPLALRDFWFKHH